MSLVYSASNMFSRTWQRYLLALRERPLRTKMTTSGGLYVVGDCVAQFGIEGRRIDKEAPVKERWDPVRTLRLTLYGGLVFAPLAHYWLGLVDRIRFTSKIGTLVTRVSLDSLLWAPFACTRKLPPSGVNVWLFGRPDLCTLGRYKWVVGLNFVVFPSALGVMEGKNIEQVKQKVEMSWLPTYMKALSVFGPVQLVNFTLIPAQHRLLVLQSVGLCWNVFLSWQNNVTNHRLAEAAAHLALATTAEQKAEAREALREAETKREEIRGAEGGGEVGVATRLSWS